MTVRFRWLMTGAALALAPHALAGQDTSETAQDTTPPGRYGHFHFGLTIHGSGISIGNAPRLNGVRLNFADAGLEQVNGVNITLWKPREPVTGTVNGLALGGLPGARDLNGVAVGAAGVVAERRARWVTVGGLGAVSNGDIQGVAVGGLGTVANRDIWGVALAGLGTVANRDVNGVAIGGLGLVANGALRGLGVGGLATVANGSITGTAVGGLAVVTNGRLTGLGIGGLSVVADDAIRGVAVAGCCTYGGRIVGLNVAATYVRTRELDGLSIAAYNRVRGLQRGLTIGIYNSAYVLNGVQIGLLNRARNNKAPFRFLPILNVHL